MDPIPIRPGIRSPGSSGTRSRCPGRPTSTSSRTELAFSLCDDLPHYENSPKRSGQMPQTIYAAMERLLVVEGDRRRVPIELTEPEDERRRLA